MYVCAYIQKLQVMYDKQNDGTLLPVLQETLGHQ